MITQELRIIGYCSDSAIEDAKDAFYNQQVSKHKELKTIIKRKNNLEKLHRDKSPSNQECFVYLIRGEKKYFRIFRELNEFIGYGEVKFLGVAMEKSVSAKTSEILVGEKCCYCEVELTVKTKTREHVIPKHKGGKIIRPCCRECNSEKAGFMLHTYIDMLNISLGDKNLSRSQVLKLNTKIKNANLLAIEIENLSQRAKTNS